MDDNGITTAYLECACSIPEHTIRFCSFDRREKEEEFLYISYQLTKLGFFKRLWVAMKYIFSGRKFDAWQETLLDDKQVKALKNICDKHLGSGNEDLINLVIKMIGEIEEEHEKLPEPGSGDFNASYERSRLLGKAEALRDFTNRGLAK